MSTTRYNLAKFDFITLKLVVTCAQTENLTAAAQSSHIALAAASRRIKELEEALGAQLFKRHAKGLTITPAGRIVVKHALAVVQSMDQLGAEISDLNRGGARHLKMCASSAAISQFLPDLLASYAVSNPHVRVELEELVSEAVVSSLRDGRANLGVFVEGPDTAGLVTKLFRQDELVLVTSNRHHLANVKTPIKFADTLDEEWISLATGSAMLQAQQQAAIRANRPLKLRMQVSSFDAMHHLVASGLGIAVIPKSTLTHLGSLKLSSRPLTDEWAKRRLLIAASIDNDDLLTASLLEYLIRPSQNAKANRKKQQ
jgi:DNA-binding transcriptional LysR family regulator